MELARDILRDIQSVAFVALGVISLRARARAGGQQSTWAAAAFGTLGALVIVGRFLPEDTDGALDWVTKALVVGIVLMPYFLYRFTGTFRGAAPVYDRVAVALTGGVCVATLALPEFPNTGEPRPAWFEIYILALLVQWTILTVLVVGRLWRAGSGQPGVARWRMRFLALGAAGINAALVVGGEAPSRRPTPTTIIVQCLGILSAFLFAIGVAPPSFMRASLRRREQEEVRMAIADLMTATRPEEVAEYILGPAARIVGASATAIEDREGRVVGTYGMSLTEAPMAIRAARDDGAGVSEFQLRDGTLYVWTSPFTPFFGRDEFELLETLARLADLALERCELFGREREFISNAAHELRTPLTTLAGLGEMLATRRREMPEDMVEESVDALHRQSERARTLINNLLDIAQLENARTRLQLTQIDLRSAVARALEGAPPPVETSVETIVPAGVQVEADLQRFDQVLVNLLSNAYRYGGPHVTVEARESDGGVLLSISDDGEGVASELVPSLFEPFVRGMRGLEKGSGLGLAIVRRLVEMFGGRVWYEPNVPHGARFHISLRKA